MIDEKKLISYIDAGHLRSADEICLSERMVVSMVEAQHKVGEWIPCGARLPDDRRCVLVTAYWHETYQVMMACYFGDGLWWCVPYNNCGKHMQKLNPIAWMPLPEPYKEDKDVN